MAIAGHQKRLDRPGNSRPEDVWKIEEFDGAQRRAGEGEAGTLRVRVFAARRRPEGGPDLPLGDPVGEEHHTGRTARLPALLVVVRRC